MVATLGGLMWWCQGVILGTKVCVASYRHSHNPFASCFVILEVNQLKEILGLKKQTSFAKKRMWPPEKPLTWNYSCPKNSSSGTSRSLWFRNNSGVAKFSCSRRWNHFLLKQEWIVYFAVSCAHVLSSRVSGISERGWRLIKSGGAVYMPWIPPDSPS